MHFDRIADTRTHEGSGHFAIESPEIVARLVGKLAFEFYCGEIDAHDLCQPAAQGRA